jgi:hypothetical protein
MRKLLNPLAPRSSDSAGARERAAPPTRRFEALPGAGLEAGP